MRLPLVESWMDLWRITPPSIRSDLTDLALITPALIYSFTALWLMLPA